MWHNYFYMYTKAYDHDNNRSGIRKEVFEVWRASFFRNIGVFKRSHRFCFASSTVLYNLIPVSLNTLDVMCPLSLHGFTFILCDFQCLGGGHGPGMENKARVGNWNSVTHQNKMYSFKSREMKLHLSQRVNEHSDVDTFWWNGKNTAIFRLQPSCLCD